MLFVPEDSKGDFAASSDFIGVGSGSTSSCLNSTSPQTTTGGSTTSSTSGGSSPSNTAGSGPGGKKSSNTGAIVGGVVGGITAAVIAVALLFWSLRRRMPRNPVSGAGFGESKGRGKTRVDLLPGGGAIGDTNGGGEDGDGAARYPLTAHHGAGEGPNDYEPVPYVLPPGEPNTDGAEYDPHRSSTSTRPLSGAEMSTVAGASSAAGGSLSKAAMAALDRSSTAVAPNAPARFLVHEDAGSLEDDQGEEGEYSDEEVVDLPPQYNSLGVLIPPERRPSRRRSTRRPVSGGEVPGSSTVTGSASARVPPIPAIPEASIADAPAPSAGTPPTT